MTVVLVMVEGRIAGELVGEEISKEALLHMSYARHEEQAQPVTGHAAAQSVGTGT